MQVTTIGLDIAKNVFQVHGIDAADKVVVRKQTPGRRSLLLLCRRHRARSIQTAKAFSRSADLMGPLGSREQRLKQTTRTHAAEDLPSEENRLLGI
jgi:hypothetical protein